MRIAFLTLAAALTLAACGDDSSDAAEPTTTTTTTTAAPLPVPGDCPGADWVTVDAGPFSFRTPADLIDQEAQGIDSLVGQFTSDTMSVGFDHGWFSGNTADEFPEARETVIIDGLTGDLVQVDVSDDPGYDAESDWLLAVYIAQPSDDEADGDTARCITETIDFA